MTPRACSRAARKRLVTATIVEREQTTLRHLALACIAAKRGAENREQCHLVICNVLVTAKQRRLLRAEARW